MLKGHRIWVFVLMEAPPGYEGWFLCSGAPNRERWAQIWQGTVKDNIRDELDEAAGQSSRDRRPQGGNPEEVKQPGSGGSRTMSRTSGPSRKSAASRNN